ncbi:MAG TPA: hypothetical protein VLU73_14755 [Methylococcaceae bacterium]|jgi:predicted dienelactone hydrolase|nr:hypothetical protein [Methylococcaceae bacterium]
MILGSTVSTSAAKSLRPSIALWLALALCFLLTGCWTKSPPLTSAEFEAKLARITSRGGYIPTRTYKTIELRETWRQGVVDIDIDILAPVEGGHFPTVLYLPGLGENADAGRLWRRAWAQAGYAVLSVQPASLGEAILSSKDAKADKRAIARRSSSAVSLENRLGHLAWVLDELTRRTQSLVSLYGRVDLSRLALAGFDLGAQAVSALCGESVEGSPKTFPTAPHAGIVLSPYVDLAAGGLEKRFSNMTLPLLTVTGSEDDDPFGISSASLRRAVWQYAPPGDKYLLILQGGAHRLLAGSELGGSRKADDASKDGDQTPQEDQDSRDRRDPDSDRIAAYGGGGRVRRGGGGDRRKRGREIGFRHIAAVESISTAFLDVSLKHDRVAKEWLLRNARPWLGRSATLQWK